MSKNFNIIASDRGFFENINANRSTSLFGQTLLGTSNVEAGNPFSLGGISQNRGDNIPPSFAQSNQSCLSSSNSNFQHNARNTQSSKHTRGDNSHFKMKPQTFNGTDFISQYEITCEINGWQYKEKSLYLANCLTGEARSLLNELDHEGKRDYNTLVEKLRNRFGSVNKSEIYRTQLKSRTRNKGETIPELAQVIKKLVRQAYPGVNKEVIETLSLDYFIDAITDSDLRLRLREAGPKSLENAEQTAVRIEAYKIADKQRSRLVGRVDFDKEQKRDEQGKSPGQIETLSEAISTLTNEVITISKQNTKSSNDDRSSNQNQGNRYQQNNHKNPRFQRFNRSNQNWRNDQRYSGYNGRYRGNNPYQATQSNNRGQNTHNEQNATNQSFSRRNENSFVHGNGASNASSFGNENNRQGNLNLSNWRATTRHQ